MLQGDTRLSGTPRDGVIARRQLAEVLVRSLDSDAALRKTLELNAERGPQQPDFEELFAGLDADAIGALDGAHDRANMPLDREPRSVMDDLDAARARVAGAGV